MEMESSSQDLRLIAPTTLLPEKLLASPQYSAHQLTYRYSSRSRQVPQARSDAYLRLRRADLNLPTNMDDANHHRASAQGSKHHRLQPHATHEKSPRKKGDKDHGKHHTKHHKQRHDGQKHESNQPNRKSSKSNGHSASQPTQSPEPTPESSSIQTPTPTTPLVAPPMSTSEPPSPSAAAATIAPVPVPVPNSSPGLGSPYSSQILSLESVQSSATAALNSAIASLTDSWPTSPYTAVVVPPASTPTVPGVPPSSTPYDAPIPTIPSTPATTPSITPSTTPTMGNTSNTKNPSTNSRAHQTPSPGTKASMGNTSNSKPPSSSTNLPAHQTPSPGNSHTNQASGAGSRHTTAIASIKHSHTGSLEHSSTGSMSSSAMANGQSGPTSGPIAIPDRSGSSGSSVPTPTVVGAVVGGIAGLVIVLLLALVLLRFLKRRREASGHQALDDGWSGTPSGPPPMSGPSSSFITGAAAGLLTRFSRPQPQSSQSPLGSERNFERVSGRRLPSRFDSTWEGPTSVQFSPGSTTGPSYPSGSSAYPSGGTFVSSGTTTGLLAKENPFADPASPPLPSTPVAVSRTTGAGRPAEVPLLDPGASPGYSSHPLGRGSNASTPRGAFLGGRGAPPARGSFGSRFREDDI